MGENYREETARTAVFRDETGNEIGRYVPCLCTTEELYDLGRRVCDAYMNSQLAPGTFLRQISYLVALGLEFDRDTRDLKNLALKELLRNSGERLLDEAHPGTDKLFDVLRRD